MILPVCQLDAMNPDLEDGGVPEAHPAEAHPRVLHQRHHSDLQHGNKMAKFSLVHCNENPIYVFLFWELCGLSPNFYIHVYVSDLYIFPGSVHIFPAAE